MTDLRDCPCCGGILNVPRHYKLRSACRCGFPTKVTWDDFAELREGIERDLRFTIEQQKRRRA